MGLDLEAIERIETSNLIYVMDRRQFVRQRGRIAAGSIQEDDIWRRRVDFTLDCKVAFFEPKISLPLSTRCEGQKRQKATIPLF